MRGLADLIGAKTGAAPAGEEPLVDLAAPSETPVPAKGKAKSDEPEESLGLEADDEGKPRAVPWTAVAEQRAKRRDAEKRATEAEKALEELRGKGSEFQAEFDREYGAFEKPLEQMKHDVSFAKAAWELRENPDVKKALAVINQHHHGALKAMTDRDTKPAAKAEAPAADPRIEQLMQEQLRGHTSSLLKAARVRSELHGTITEYVLAQNPHPTADAVRTVVQELVQERGWTNEFLRGAEVKPKRASVPNPGGQNAGTPAPAKGKAEESPSKKPATLSARERANNSRMHELLQQRGVSA